MSTSRRAGSSRAASEAAKSKAATNLPTVSKKRKIEEEDEEDQVDEDHKMDENEDDEQEAMDSEDDEEEEIEQVYVSKKKKVVPVIEKPTSKKSKTVTTPTKPTKPTTPVKSRLPVLPPSPLPIKSKKAAAAVTSSPSKARQSSQSSQQSQQLTKKQQQALQQQAQQQKQLEIFRTKPKNNLKPLNVDRLEEYDEHMSKPLTNEKIVKRLKKLDEYLQERKRGDTGDALINVLGVLIEDRFITSKDFEIKLMVSCCISEILRIYAPRVPFDIPVLEIILKLYIEQVLSGDQVDRKLFPQYFQMLERIALIKLFAMLVMVDAKMIVPFFKDCLNRVQGDQEHRPMDMIMATLLNTMLESLDDIPISLWNELLETLVEREKGGIPTAKAIFVHDLIETNKGLFRGHFEIFLKDLVDQKHSKKPIAPPSKKKKQTTTDDEESGREDKEMEAETEAVEVVSNGVKRKINEILFEMYNILPEFIYPALNSLEYDLENENVNVRKGAVLVLSRCYSTEHASDELIEKKPALYATFLNRFKDVDLSIRTIMMEFSQHFSSSLDHEKKRVLEMVRTRFSDSDAGIRCKTIQIFSSYILKNPELVSAELMRSYLNRARDKDSSVRKEAEISLSTIWRSIREKYGPIDSWSNELVECFSEIPKTLIHCFALHDDDRYRIEIAFDSILLPKHSDIENRSKVFLEIYQTLDQPNRALIKKYFEEKKSLRDEFFALYRFLKAPKPILTAKTLNEKKQQQLEFQQQFDQDIEVYITQVDNYLPKFLQQSSKRMVRELITPQNKKIYDLLVLISDPNTTFKEQYDIKVSIISKAQNESKFSEFIKYMVNKLAYSIIGKENIKHFFKSLTKELGVNHHDNSGKGDLDLLEEFNVKKYDKELKELPMTLELLLMLSQVYPNIFDGYGEQLVGFLTCSRTIVYPILQILFNCSSNIKFSKKTTLKATLDILLRLVQVPQPVIARLAFKTFIKLATPVLTHKDADGKIDNTRLADTLTDLANGLFEQLEDKSKNLISILEVLGCLGKRYSNVLVEHTDALEILLTKKILTGACTLDFNQKVGLDGGPDNTKHCKDVSIKIAGIKCLANYLLGSREITRKSHEMVNKLFEFYVNIDKPRTSGTGKNAVSFTYTDLEKGHLRINTAIQLFRIFQRPQYEKEITNQQFVIICNSTSTFLRGDPLIRKLLEKISHCIRLNRIPLKYLAAFGMAAKQPKPILTLVRTLTTTVAKTRRTVVTRLAAALQYKSLPNFYPESSIPYFVYVVAHRDGFVSDGPAYAESVKFLNFFIDLLVEEKDNYSIIHTTLTTIKQKTLDATDKKSKAHIIAAELGLQICAFQYENRKWKPQVHPIPITLPPQLYVLKSEDDMEYDTEIEKDIELDYVSLLPKRFKLPPLDQLTNNQLLAIVDRDLAAKPKRKVGKPAAKSTNKKPAARRRKKKGESSDEDEDEGEEEESKIKKPVSRSTSKKPAAKSTSKKPAARRRKKKDESSEEEDDEEEEEDEEEEDDQQLEEEEEEEEEEHGEEEEGEEDE